jgi:hypothetical protein
MPSFSAPISIISLISGGSLWPCYLFLDCEYWVASHSTTNSCQSGVLCRIAVSPTTVKDALQTLKFNSIRVQRERYSKGV